VLFIYCTEASSSVISKCGVLPRKNQQLRCVTCITALIQVQGEWLAMFSNFVGQYITSSPNSVICWMQFCEKSLLLFFRCICPLLRRHIPTFLFILRLEVLGQALVFQDSDVHFAHSFPWYLNKELCWCPLLLEHPTFPDTSIKNYVDVHSCWNTQHSLIPQ
jgi:hypothetical protein